MSKDRFTFDDGGRSQYFKSTGGDCVTRAVAIATGLDYMEIYKMMAEGNRNQRRGKSESKTKQGKATALHGINTGRKWFKDLMVELGFEWTATMAIGQGCKTHLCREELPDGTLVVAVSKHYTTMIDGVIKDTYDPSRWENDTPKRCVYGYWKLKR